jgi:hypothetical protein
MNVSQVRPVASITPRIATVRGQRVVIDADLAALYGVQTKRFNEAVKRNLAKFPPDFMFVLTAEEATALRSQFATSNGESSGRGGRRYAPRVFTEHDNFSRATQAQLKQVFDALRALMSPPEPPKRPIGFVTPKEPTNEASA